MGQKQIEIPLQFIDGMTSRAVRTGNNAAWICSCERSEPLIGYSDTADGWPSSDVVCPSCGRTYRVVAPAPKKVPTHIEEISPRDA